MSEFKPKNIVQKLAYERRKITVVTDFEAQIGEEPFLVKRTTARYWWDNGIPENMRLSSADALARFLWAKVDDLIEDKENGQTK
jgi:hypothetical protein